MRRIRARIRLNAVVSVRISAAPDGLRSGGSRPLPKSSTAAASRLIGLTWFRMKMTAMPIIASDVPISQARKR